MGKVKTLSICLSSFNFQWIPIYRNGSLQTGLFELPVMLDPPSADIRQSPTEQAPSATKWVDNKKPIFSVEITSATTVHPLDNALDQVPHVLLSRCAAGASGGSSSG